MLNTLLSQPEFLQFMAIGIMLCLTTIGVALGQGRISSTTTQALYEQPSAASDISRVSLISLALCETAMIMTLSAVFIVLFAQEQLTFYQSFAQLALIGVMGIVSIAGGYLSSLPAEAAIKAIARQPFFSGSIMVLMLITTLFIQTPILFGFLLSLTITLGAASKTSLLMAIPYLSAGLAFGLGTIGPLIGLARYAQAALTAVGQQRHQYKQIFSFTILCQAMIEAPILFVTILAFILVGTDCTTTSRAVALIVAGLMMGIGTILPGIASGHMTSRAVMAMTQTPEKYGEIRQSSFICQALIDTLPLYCLILAFVFLLVA